MLYNVDDKSTVFKLQLKVTVPFKFSIRQRLSSGGLLLPVDSWPLFCFSLISWLSYTITHIFVNAWKYSLDILYYTVTNFPHTHSPTLLKISYNTSSRYHTGYQGRKSHFCLWQHNPCQLWINFHFARWTTRKSEKCISESRHLSSRSAVSWSSAPPGSVTVPWSSCRKVLLLP